MVAQLKDIVNPFASFLFHKDQIVYQFRRRDKGFFADNIAAQAQASGDMRVVQVVRGADGHVVESVKGAALEPVGEFLKSLELSEKFALRRDTVDDANRVVDVIGHRQIVA